MPTEAPSDEELKLFLMKPGFALLKCFPSQIQATKVMAVSSSHSPDEECIDNFLVYVYYPTNLLSSAAIIKRWLEDPEAKFSHSLSALIINHGMPKQILQVPNKDFAQARHQYEEHYKTVF
uniref:Uncharacterized protein n=1 Tax=Salix viminalis TaxID=40686 RepID=A0A6N2KQ48_SALVM